MTKVRCIRNFKKMIKLICRVYVYLVMFSFGENSLVNFCDDVGFSFICHRNKKHH